MQGKHKGNTVKVRGKFREIQGKYRGKYKERQGKYRKMKGKTGKVQLFLTKQWLGNPKQEDPRLSRIFCEKTVEFSASVVAEWMKNVEEEWDIIWKSRGGRVVNGVPREVPRPKPEGPQAPRVLAAGLPRGTPFTTLHPRLFHIMSFFGHPGLVKRDFFHCRQIQPVPREYHTQYYLVEVQILVEINPNILVRRFQRM